MRWTDQHAAAEIGLLGAARHKIRSAFPRVMTDIGDPPGHARLAGPGRRAEKEFCDSRLSVIGQSPAGNVPRPGTRFHRRQAQRRSAETAVACQPDRAKPS